MEPAHHTLIGRVVLAHLNEKFLVERVRNHSHQLTINARRESKLSVRLRRLMLACRSCFLSAHQMVKIALENEGARSIDIALCELKCLKALFSRLARDDHKRI